MSVTVLHDFLLPAPRIPPAARAPTNDTSIHGNAPRPIPRPARRPPPPRPKKERKPGASARPGFQFVAPRPEEPPPPAPPEGERGGEEVEPGHPKLESHPLSQSYKTSLPTSLSCILLFIQRLLILATCCGLQYDSFPLFSFFPFSYSF